MTRYRTQCRELARRINTIKTLYELSFTDPEFKFFRHIYQLELYALRQIQKNFVF